MSLRELIGAVWVTPARAKAMGFTHHARIWGIVPGFAADPDGDMMWIARTPLLHPVEDALGWLWMTLREMRGEEPDFMFEIRGEIE